MSLKSKSIYLTPILLTIVLFFTGYNKGLDIFINPVANIDGACKGDVLCQIEKASKTIVVLVYDDVSITLRVAKHFLAYGNTNFNTTDSAQAATSYLLPIVASPLFLLPDSIAVLIFSFFGFLSVYMSWYILVKGQNDENKILLILVVFVNTTISTYMLSGWENVHQGLLVLLSWYVVINRKGSLSYILIGLLSSIAILTRIDSVFIIFSIYLFFLYQKDFKAFFISSAAGLVVGFIYFYFQLSWFEYITPTTARLKTGFSIDVVYNAKYLLEMLVSGSCLLYIIYFIYELFRKGTLRDETKFIIIGSFITLIYAAYVSDYFSFGRMYIAVFILLTYTFCTLEKLKLNKYIIYIISALSLFYVSFDNFKYELVYSNSNSGANSAEGQQYILATELPKYIKPEDGAIGLFWLGATSFALPNYEIADFLGKADESIAQLDAIKGLPIGHNKFNSVISLDKWNVAVVPMRISQAMLSIDEDLIIIEKKESYYWSEFKLELIDRGYTFCRPVNNISWGVYVRKDLLSRFENCD